MVDRWKHNVQPERAVAQCEIFYLDPPYIVVARPIRLSGLVTWWFRGGGVLLSLFAEMSSLSL